LRDGYAGEAKAGRKVQTNKSGGALRNGMQAEKYRSRRYQVEAQRRSALANIEPGLSVTFRR